jgi:hypothetical protein
MPPYFDQRPYKIRPPTPKPWMNIYLRTPPSEIPRNPIAWHHLNCHAMAPARSPVAFSWPAPRREKGNGFSALSPPQKTQVYPSSQKSGHVPGQDPFGKLFRRYSSQQFYLERFPKYISRRRINRPVTTMESPFFVIFFSERNPDIRRPRQYPVPPAWLWWERPARPSPAFDKIISGPPIVYPDRR